MIITLRGANFSSNNINDMLNSYFITVQGSNLTDNLADSVDKETNSGVSGTITINDGYVFDDSRTLVVKMGTQTLSGVANIAEDGKSITINISQKITGNVVITVPTKSVGGGGEPDTPTSYTITYKYMSGSTSIKTQTTEQVPAGTTKTFSTSSAPVINGYTVSSVSPSGQQTINSNITVTYNYTVTDEEDTPTIGTITLSPQMKSGALANGNVQPSTSYSYSEPINVQAGEILEITSAGADFDVVSEVSADGTYQSTLLKSQTSTAGTASKTYYIAMIETCYVSICVKSTETYTIKKINNGYTANTPTFSTQGGYINGNGQITTSTAYYRTSPIALKQGEMIVAKVGGNGMAAIATSTTNDDIAYNCQVLVNNSYGTSNYLIYHYIATEDCYACCSYKQEIGEPIIKIFS